MSIAVLPPTAASTMPSSVVGISTTGTPRSQLAAANPAKSVVAPPPIPTTQSDLVTLDAASQDQSRASTLTSLAASPLGTSVTATVNPASARARQAGRAIAPRRSSWMTATVWARLPTRSGSAPSTPVPMTTSYGCSPPTRIRVSVIRASRLARSAATSSGAMSSVETVIDASSA